jgi:alpha-N-acetylglucosamine transferase|tara:strand:+ start:551 stop:760 length:210 start_codon:yes stop_codon:yes gene_type:complete
MASWQNSSGKENHKSLFENVEYDRCIFCGGDRTEIARTDFVLMFSEFEYTKGSICKSCYHANAKQVKAV